MSDPLGPSSPTRLWRGIFSRTHFWKPQPITTAHIAYCLLVWLGGSIALTAATWACFQLRTDLSTASLVLRLVVVVLALFDSYLSSLFFSLVGTLLLDYFFTAPLLTLKVDLRDNVITLTAFLVTSLFAAALVRYMRSLADAQQNQASLLELTTDSMLVRDEEDMIRYWNRAAEHLYGWKRAEVIGKRAHALLSTEFPVARDEITATLLRSGHWEGELVHTNRAGAKIVVATRWSAQVDSHGKLRAVLESDTDVTRRKAAEEALRRSEAEFLAEAQTLSKTGSFGWDTGTNAASWSTQTFRILEYDLQASPSIELFVARLHPEDGQSFWNMFAAAVTAREGFDFHARLLIRHDVIKHIHLVCRVAHDAPDGVQYVGAMMDVTAARQAEEQLRSTQAELERVARATVVGELSASIAHEVNQPLAAILAFAKAAQRWIKREPPDANEVSACLDGVIDSGNSASGIVQRVRELTMRSSLQRDVLDMNEVITETVALLRWEISRQGISLRSKLANNLPPIVGNRIQLQQVLTNLLINAMQAMDGISERPRNLLIESHLNESGHVGVAVTDTGTGIRDADAARLFDAFYTTKSTGMGMGLSISRSIINSHDGQIGAANNADAGASFQFSLPPAPPSTSQGAHGN